MIELTEEESRIPRC